MQEKRILQCFTSFFFTSDLLLQFDSKIKQDNRLKHLNYSITLKIIIFFNIFIIISIFSKKTKLFLLKHVYLNINRDRKRCELLHLSKVFRAIL